MCRQRWTEQVIADAYTKLNGTMLQYGTKLSNIKITEHASNDAVITTVGNPAGQELHIKSKYIVGADGGRSIVRKLAGIEFEGEETSRRWVRIDGIVETNMPEARYGLTSIQSASHGSVLWVCLDHNATRVGFSIPDTCWPAEKEITQDDVIQEARKALEPFTLEFKSVDWWTVYSIGQRLAADYRAEERIFVAGDAAHTYSSGSAQGMNVGLQDAVNLAWKLAGRIKGHFVDRLLETYNMERRAVAEQIIAQDKIISLLTEGKIPLELQDDPEKDPYKILFRQFKKNQAYNLGLGIAYSEDDLTIVRSSATVALGIRSGERVRDILVQRPGIRIPLRLHSQLKCRGNFAVMVFCGDTSKTENLITDWRNYLDGAESLMRYKADIFDVVAILIHDNYAGAPDESLKTHRFGQVFYDADGSAHERYGVAHDKGAILIVRPDGLLGTAFGLNEGHLASAYFAKFTTARKEKSVVNGSNGVSAHHITKGEIELNQTTCRPLSTSNRWTI